ncbi:MAG: polymerase, sigma-24 subunit, subfamily [Modestobacter sp.]|nr:polymerase, sigma-24 subunit, subfamily [Modestobacter sp.]
MASAGGGPLAELLDRYARPALALALARRIVVDDRLAEDVVQEAFFAYWRNPAAFDAARGSFSAWLLALVHHKAVDAVRREASQRRRLDAAAERVEPVIALVVAELVADGMVDARVRSAIEALPAVQREALVLAYRGGFTQREIALRTGAPLGTVKSRMLVGMRRLHDGLSSVVPALIALPGAAPVAPAG